MSHTDKIEVPGLGEISIRVLNKGQGNDEYWGMHTVYGLSVSYNGTLRRFAYRTGLGISDEPDGVDVLAELFEECASIDRYSTVESFTYEVGVGPARGRQMWRQLGSNRDRLLDLFEEDFATVESFIGELTGTNGFELQS